MLLWILSVKSESGDSYGPWTYDREKTDEEILEFLARELGHDHPDLERTGPGSGGTYLHFQWNKEISHLAK